MAGSSVAESAHHYIYDSAGNIASKQVENPGSGATMTSYGHNTLNQLTAIGGSAGVKTVIVRGITDEPASVKAKTGTSSTWKDARMLSGRSFEADLDLVPGSNEIDIQARDGSNNTSNYTYALNMATTAAATPSYDADGNMLSDGVRSYDWDSQSRLVQITWGGISNMSTRYKYNALGQRSERIEKTGATETAHYYYLYDGINLVNRYSGGTVAANVDRRYFSQGEQRLTGPSSWSSQYYSRDHLGSIREVMNADGTLAARYDYDPYGKRSTQYQSAAYTDGCDLGYTGHITQPSPVNGQTEIVLTLYRAYDPELGRWLSVDPIGESVSLNLYGYGPNNPFSGSDPDGRFWNFVLGAVLGAALDVAAQRIENGSFDHINLTRVAISAGAGALGAGLGASVAKITGSIAIRVALNTAGSAVIGMGAKVANNKWVDHCKSWDDGLVQAGIVNSVLGGFGSVVGDNVRRFFSTVSAQAAWQSATLAQKQFILGGTMTVAKAEPSIISTAAGNIAGNLISNSGEDGESVYKKYISGSGKCK